MRNAKLLLLAFTFYFASCDDQSADEPSTRSADTSNVQSPPADTTHYDPSEDGMLVAPELTRKLGDTLGIKMYEVTAKPGDSIPLHSHPDHAFYVIEGGRAAIYFGNDRQEWDLKPGMGFVNGPVKDAAKIIGKSTVKFLVVDIYRDRPRTK